MVIVHKNRFIFKIKMENSILQYNIIIISSIEMRIRKIYIYSNDKVSLLTLSLPKCTLHVIIRRIGMSGIRSRLKKHTFKNIMDLYINYF